METKIKTVEKFDKIELPAGLYVGIWSGYQIEIPRSDGCGYRLTTTVGVRGTTSCVVTVSADGKIEVKP